MRIGKRAVAVLAGVTLALNASAAGLCALLCQIDNCGASQTSHAQKSCCDEKQPSASKPCCQKMSKWNSGEQIALIKSAVSPVDIPIISEVFAISTVVAFIDPHVVIDQRNDRAPPDTPTKIHAIRGPPETQA